MRGTFKKEKFYQESYLSFKGLKNSMLSYVRYYNSYRYSKILNELLSNE
ncbi:IS3 family transposase [Enterococcus sp. DIV0187]